MNDDVDPVVAPDLAGPKVVTKPVKARLVKVIPTDRVSFEKQLSALRAYAAASGQEKKAVTNDEVAAVMSDLAPSSISLCNPFFSDVGLLIPEGRKQRPDEAVFDFQHAFEWSPESAGEKLHGVFADTWAAKALVPKLTFRELSKDEAIHFLAEESKATKAHRRNLETLLEFLNVAGVVRVEGNTVLKANGSPAKEPDGARSDSDSPPAPSPPPPARDHDLGAALHPFIRGLLDKLPEPEGEWTISGRIKWLQTAANIFDLLYATDEEDAPGVEVKIKREGDP